MCWCTGRRGRATARTAGRVISLPASSRPGRSAAKRPGAGGAAASNAKRPGGGAVKPRETTPTESTPVGDGARSHQIDLAYRVAGTIVALFLAAITAFYEALLTPLHVTSGSSVIRLPVAPLVAIVVNIGLFWFGRTVTGRTGLALLPAIAWFIVIFVAGNRTPEGDLLIAGNNWVGVLTILLGALAWAVGAYASMFRRGRTPMEGGAQRPHLPSRRLGGPQR